MAFTHHSRNSHVPVLSDLYLSPQIRLLLLRWCHHASTHPLPFFSSFFQYLQDIDDMLTASYCRPCY